MSSATAKNKKTQINAAVAAPKIGTSIATGFSRHRVLSTTLWYSQTNTLKGKNKITKLFNNHLDWPICLCVEELVGRRYP